MTSHAPAFAPETQAARQRDLRAFAAWCAREGCQDVRRALPGALAAFLRERRAQGYAEGTLRRVASTIVAQLRVSATRPEAWRAPSPGRHPTAVSAALAERPPVPAEAGGADR